MLDKLIIVCKKYREKEVGYEELQSSVGLAESQVTRIEDNKLRDFLIGTDGELDVLWQITSTEFVFKKSLPIVDKIEKMVDSWIESHPDRV